MKKFFEEYGGVTLGICAVLVLIAMVSPVGAKVKDSLTGIVNGFSESLTEGFSGATGSNTDEPDDESEISITMPVKSDIITMDLGTTAAAGTNNTYRVLKTSGTQAFVVAMYDYNTSTKYNTSSITTTFSDGSTGQKYEGSNLDTVLNTTFYGAMNDTAKAAIVPQTINQTIWGYNTGSSTDFDYAQEFNWGGTYKYHQNKGSVSVGERYVFALDMTDLVDYFGNTAASKQLMQLFYNQDTPTTITYPWLRSANADNSNDCWPVDSYSGIVGYDYYVCSYAVRPAFVIDLSKVDFTIN